MLLLQTVLLGAGFELHQGVCTDPESAMRPIMGTKKPWHNVKDPEARVKVAYGRYGCGGGGMHGLTQGFAYVLVAGLGPWALGITLHLNPDTGPKHGPEGANLQSAVNKEKWDSGSILSSALGL